jgi:hypothetical protein
VGSYFDCYKHLDDTDPFRITLNSEELAQLACGRNYGAHRLLSAMVHELRRKSVDGKSELADGIEELLNKGLYF